MYISPYYLKILKYSFFLILLIGVKRAFAENQGDLLAGTEQVLTTTINNTGKKFIYIAEGIFSLALYIKTKNLLFLSGIVVVAVFINILLKIVGFEG